MVFESPEYQDAVRMMIRDVLTSDQYRSSQVETVSQILTSSQFIEHVAGVAKQIES